MNTKSTVSIVVEILAAFGVFVSTPCFAQGGPTASAGAVVEDSAPGWTWSGMDQMSGDQFHGGTALVGKSPATATYTFSGTAVKIVGASSKTIVVDHHVRLVGSMSVLIDGKAANPVSLQPAKSNTSATVLELSGLTPGNHVLNLKALNDWMVVDYIVVGMADTFPKSANPIIDSLLPNDVVSESAHHLVSNSSRTGNQEGRPWRDATPGGWFQYEMKVDPESKTDLVVWYWGPDTGRTFDIYVNKVKVATQSLNGGLPANVFPIVYHLPDAAVGGGTTIIVGFASPTSLVGGVFGITTNRRP